MNAMTINLLKIPGSINPDCHQNLVTSSLCSCTHLIKISSKPCTNFRFRIPPVVGMGYYTFDSLLCYGQYLYMYLSYMFIYSGFYVAFNTVQVMSQQVVGMAEETSTYSQGCVL